MRAEEIDWKPWRPRWISVDWGFEHPAAVYWHAAAPLECGGLPPHSGTRASRDADTPPKQASPADGGGEFPHSTPSRLSPRVVTYREYVTHRTPPRELAREKIDAIYLSPDAFARRTDEAAIAEQMGDVFAAAGLPRPVPTDNDRVGGWMLMYQMLDAGEWLLTENCIELIRTLPNLVRDPARIEDIEKMEGDDPADAARYGLKSRYAARRGGHAHPPLEQRLAARVVSADPTIRAIQARKAQVEETRGTQPVSFLRRRR